jgi:hypothetical protein
VSDATKRVVARRFELRIWINHPAATIHRVVDILGRMIVRVGDRKMVAGVVVRERGGVREGVVIDVRRSASS